MFSGSTFNGPFSIVSCRLHCHVMFCFLQGTLYFCCIHSTLLFLLPHKIIINPVRFRPSLFLVTILVLLCIICRSAIALVLSCSAPLFSCYVLISLVFIIFGLVLVSLLKLILLLLEYYFL